MTSGSDSGSWSGISTSIIDSEECSWGARVGLPSLRVVFCVVGAVIAIAIVMVVVVAAVVTAPADLELLVRVWNFEGRQA